MGPPSTRITREASPRVRGTPRTRDRVTVVLADHEHVPRRALRSWLEGSGQVTVVAETADALKVSSMVARARPDVLVVDFEIQPSNGADVVLAVRRRRPEVGAVVLSRSLRESHLVQCLRSGASAYVSKLAQPEELAAAIRTAAEREKYVSRPFSRRPLDYWLRLAERGAGDVYESLTVREREMLHLIAKGWTGTTIARRQGLSRRTVESHRENIKKKLGIGNQAGLIRYAIERQLMPP